MTSVVEESNPYNIPRLSTKLFDRALYLAPISFGQCIYFEAQLLTSIAHCSVVIHKIAQSTNILVFRVADH